MASVSTSSSSALSSTLSSSPLHRLASYFEKARKRAGIITLPSPTLDTIRQYREQWSQHSGREVDAIVRALEPTNTDVCQRLDSMALVIICSILVHTESCLAQQRGLCLLAETLHGSETASSQAIADRRSKKISVGHQALVPLIKGFTKRENFDKTRRWMGVLALELLKDCEQNIALLRDDAPTLQSLNDLIEQERCHVLKLLAGSIIHTMLCAGVSSEQIWPSETDIRLYSQFPRAQLYDSQWITAFEGFVEELGSRSALTQQKSCVLFAFALYVGHNRYVTQDESAILVTVSEDVNIIIPNSATGPAVYIDVPLDRVDSATVDSRANNQSQTPRHVLVMKLSHGDGITCYLNASGKDSHSIALAFADKNDAKTFMRLIQPRTANGEKAEHYGQSEEVDVSQVRSDDVSADELAVSLPSIVHESRDMTTQVAPSPDRHPSVGPSLSASQVLPNLSPRQASVTIPKQQPSSVAPYVERSMLVSMGVDVSEPASPSDIQTKAGSYRKPFTNHIASQRISKIFDRTSDTGLPSPMRWKNASDIIDNAPEFRSPNDTTVDQQAAESLIPHAEDYDSTYDISPQNQKKRSSPAQHHSSPHQLQPIPDGRLRGHHSTDPGEHPKSQEMLLASSDVATVSKLQRSSKAEILTNVSGPSATSEGSTDEVPSSKKGRRLRNTEDGIAKKVETPADLNPRSLARKFAQKTPQSRKPHNEKILAIPETQAEIVKQAKPAKKPAVAKGKRKASRGDEYDLMSSPEPTAPNLDSDTLASNKLIRSRAQKSGGSNENAKSIAGPSAPKSSNLGSKSVLKAKTPRNEPQKDKALEKHLIQERRTHDTGRFPEAPLHKKVKHTITQSVPAPKGKKASRLPAKPKPKADPKVKRLSAPLGQMRSRPRRAAAIKANERIQGLEGSDEITDVDDVQITAPRRTSSAATNQAGKVSAKAVITRDILSERESIGLAPSLLQPAAQIPTSEECADGSVKLAITSHHEMKNRVFESKLNTSSPEKTSVIHELSLPPNPVTNGNAKTKEPLTNASPLSSSLRIVAIQDDAVNQAAKQPANGDTACCDHENRNKRLEQHPMPKDVDEVPDEIGASDIIPDHYLQQVQVGIMGDTEGSHFQEAMPETDGESPQSNQAQKRLDTVANDQASDKLTNVRKPLQHAHRGIEETMPGIDGQTLDLYQVRKPLNTAADLARPAKSKIVRELPRHGRGEVAVDSRDSHSQAKDPFEAKLGPLVSMSEVVTNRHRAAQNSEQSRMVRGPKTPSTKASERVPGKSIKPSTKAQKINRTTKPVPTIERSQKKRLEQAIALPNNKLSEPARSEKGIVNGDCGGRNKSGKSSLNGARAKVKEGKEVIETETPLPVTSRKPELISWTVSGPKNQGTLSAKEKIIPKDAQAIKRDKRTKGAELDDKKMIAPFLDEPASWEHDHRTRGQDRVHPTPRHNPKHVPPMRPELQVSVIHEKAHRFSSQSTKVNANGSPMPFVDQSRQDVRQDGTPGDVKFPVEDHDLLAEENDQYEDEPQLPTVKDEGPPETNDLAFASMTSNRKEVPSSPHAPSTLAVIPPHVVLRNGEMMNEKTLESIVPTLPQDPFVGGDARPPSSFMNLLHKSIAAERRRKSLDAKKGRSPYLVKRKSVVEEDDPDKTLVEPAPKRQRNIYHTVPESSSTLETVSRDITPAEASSDQESDSTTVRWQKTLEPHQSNMLDVLTHITHRLVRHLVDKETAAKDIVNDYEMRGNNLLQGYDKGRRKDLEADMARLELSKENLATMYTQAQKNVRKLSGDMSKTSTRALEVRLAQWHQQQQRVGSAIERAIEACADG